jgi:predicted  nucleic acid-binding Zn-ribbon protein
MPAQVTKMHIKLLFDLDNLIGDLEEPAYKKLGFKIDEAADLTLRKTREDILKKIPRDLADTYEILKKRYQRAVAPVENGFCFGCFQKLPTEITTKSTEIIMCPNCGRILYWRE